MRRAVPLPRKEVRPWPPGVSKATGVPGIPGEGGGDSRPRPMSPCLSVRPDPVVLMVVLARSGTQGLDGVGCILNSSSSSSSSRDAGAL
ncbi:hypothetical protein KC359_g50 [Hortaea werneckii]|nr:hypothetical protein KC359_g50 [Hortaea werneckii]KAI7514939.1 hypothetical protein KC347_g46 [Hortaea werneckii]